MYDLQLSNKIKLNALDLVINAYFNQEYKNI